MLAHGHLQEPCLFRTSSSVRGETPRMHKEEVDSMVIVDTVGLGESQHGSVSNKEAQGILYNFFSNLDLQEGFHYFAFVRKWGRNDFLDEQLWKFFTQAFKGAEKNFVVIFTHFDKGEGELEVPETRELLLKMYHPCVKWICVDFPAPDQKLTAALKKVNDRRRARSAARLKEKLAAFFCPPLAPDVCLQLRVGRVLLLGRRSPAKAFLGNLLVKGNFLKSSTDEELPFSMSHHRFSSASVLDQPFDKAKGRRWEVVNFRDFDSYMVKGHFVNDERELALSLIGGIVTTLMQEEGFSHVVYVQESGQSTRPWEDDPIDKMLWQMILALLSTAIRNERLVLAMATGDQHPDTAQHKKLASRDERLDTAQRIIEQVLQKEVDTQSTFFKLEVVSQTQKWHLIKEAAVTLLTPMAKVMRKEPTRRLFRSVGRRRTLSKLSSAYEKIVNKEIRSSVQLQRMWKEQKNEIVWEEEAEAEEEAEEEQAADDGDDRFCESFGRLVVGEGLDYCRDYCYLRMKCTIPVVEGIEVTVEQRINTHVVFATWGVQLAVLAPNGQTQIGHRILVNDSTDPAFQNDEWQVHSETVTDPRFLENIQAHRVIALYLCSQRYYIRYASIRLLGPPNLICDAPL
ncbi:hypothetical protein L7F22_014742 [Adiantum nelumboides]|nr:hypothetical protein [Adiantum nelumboides]